MQELRGRDRVVHNLSREVHPSRCKTISWKHSHRARPARGTGRSRGAGRHRGVGRALCNMPPRERMEKIVSDPGVLQSFAQAVMASASQGKMSVCCVGLSPEEELAMFVFARTFSRWLMWQRNPFLKVMWS